MFDFRLVYIWYFENNFFDFIDMLGYGLSKAAVHHFTQSLADKNSGLPVGTKVLAIAP